MAVFDPDKIPEAEKTAREFVKGKDPLVFPFISVRRLPAAGSELLRKLENPFLCGFGDREQAKIMTRALVEVIVVLTCPEDDLIVYCEDGEREFRKEVSRAMMQHTEPEILAQADSVNAAMQGVYISTVIPAASEEAKLVEDDEKK